MTALLEDGISRGEFRDVDAEGFARLLVGAIDAARTLKIVGVDEDAPATFGRAIERFLVPSLVADRSPDGSV